MKKHIAKSNWERERERYVQILMDSHRHTVTTDGVTKGQIDKVTIDWVMTDDQIHYRQSDWQWDSHTHWQSNQRLTNWVTKGQYIDVLSKGDRQTDHKVSSWLQSYREPVVKDWMREE